MKYVTVKRTLVKTMVHRVWVLTTTYIMLLLTGQSLTQAVWPTIIINVIWLLNYYMYERWWSKVQWGIENR